VTARSGAPPEQRTGPCGQGARSDGAGGGTSTSTIQRPADQGARPQWSGCPAGCDPGYHEQEDVRISRCNFCLSLDVAAREALHDCSEICPMRQAVA
jgi:hypothetical protein